MSNRNAIAVQFLQGLNIKSSALGGFDKTATFEKFKELSDLYEEIVAVERDAKKNSEAKYEQILQTLQKQVDNAKAFAAKASGETMDLKRRIGPMQTRVESAETELKRKTREDEALKLELASLQRQVENAQAEIQRLKDAPLDSELYLHQEAELMSIKAELAARKAEVATMHRQMAEKEEALSDLKAKLVNAIRNLRRLSRLENQMLTKLETPELLPVNPAEEDETFG